MTRKRSAEPWEVAASGYTAVILVHTETIAGAFSKRWYASGFALTRPVLEALLKQSWLATCNGADGWEHKVSRRQQVTQKELRAMSESYGGGDELADWWKELSPVLSDFVHGGQGQLTANHDTLVPRYPATWFQTTMSIATLAMLITSGLFWAHLGERERADAAPGVRRSEAAGARMVPPGEGNEARGDGRRGVGVSQSTAESGELSPRDPVEGRGPRQVAPVEGKTANTPRLGPVSTSRQRIAELAR